MCSIIRADHTKPVIARSKNEMPYPGGSGSLISTILHFGLRVSKVNSFSYLLIPAVSLDLYTPKTTIPVQP